MNHQMTSRRRGVLSIVPSVLVASLAGAGLADAQARTPAANAPTFTKDVAPILQRSCQRCHRPGSIAPMSLLTYDEARPWARSMKVQVAGREMPPWHVDRNVGVQRFKDDPSLTDTEIATIVKWADAGAPRGNPADMPPPVQWAPDDRWGIGTPDMILTIKDGDIPVAAAGADQWMNVQMQDPNLTEDRYIQAIEIKPIKGVPTVHHANASYVVDPADGIGVHLVEFAVGKAGEIYPEESGKVLKAGSTMMMNLHLHSVGTAMPANLALGLKFWPKDTPPKHVQLTRHVGDQEEGIDIPPGAADVRSEGFTILSQPARLTAFQPHMHNRGKRQCLEAIYPPTGGTGGRADLARVETISCANFHFAWHLQYAYADGAQPLLPAGTVLRVVSWHDNSAANRYNPDPTNWVGFGQRTIDDMSFLWVTMYNMTQQEFDAAVKERHDKAKAATDQPQ